MTTLKPDTDQPQDKSFMDRVTPLCTVTNGDKIPHTRQESTAASELLFTETAERQRAVRGDDRT